MPQLSQLALVYQSQWFWLLLVLAAIYFFIGRGIVPKVEETVDLRDAQIAKDLAEADRLQAEAEATEETWRARINAAHEEAREASAEAKAKSAREAEKRLAKADQEIAAKTEAAETELGAAVQSAMAEVEAVAVETTREIVAKLTGAKVTEAAARKAVAGAMSRA
jgi:F-type H+-transporting ATPase subunit b